MNESPQKKIKNVTSSSERKRRAVERLRRISLQERCLMMERALQAEDDLQEVPEEFKGMWDYVEEAAEMQRLETMAKRAGISSQGGGGWPETAARSP